MPPGRTSAGSFFPGPPAYYDYPSSARTNRDPAPGPRNSGDRNDAPRVIPVRPRSPPRKSRDDGFAVRPRPRTLSMDPEDSQTRRPLSLVTSRPSNRDNRPIVTKDTARPASPPSKSGGAQLEASFIVPASSSSGRHHHRHSSLTTGDRLMPREQGLKDRIYPGSDSRSSDIGGLRSTVRQHPPRERLGRDDRGYGFEYTNAKEELLRDIAPRPRPRRESYTGARPTSMISLDRPEKIYGRIEKEVGPPVTSRGFEGIGRSESLKHRVRDDDFIRRESTKGYPRNERDDRVYRQAPRSQIAVHHPTPDDYVPYPEENVRHQRPRRPTLDDETSEVRPSRRKLTLDEDIPESGAREPGRRKPTLDENRMDPRMREPLNEKSDRDEDDRPRRHREARVRRDDDHRTEPGDRDDRSRRNRDDLRDRRDKVDREDEGGLTNNFVAGGVTAAAATGMAAEAARRHHHRETHDDEGRPRRDILPTSREPDRDHASESTSLSGEPPEEEDREQRRRRRRREREREERDYKEAREEERLIKEPEVRKPREEVSRTQELDSSAGASHLAPHGQGGEPSLREQVSYERPAASDEKDRLEIQSLRRLRPRRHHSRTRTNDSYSESSSSGSEGSVGKARRQPRVVTPSNDMGPPPVPAPKGILKPPREKFPEDPSAIREGVAPLDAAKKGIPLEARWTKINRRLVNPEALEQEGVRFEEFPDHVIVLKVLSQEEINRFTAKTYEIREKRRVAEGVGASGGSA